MDESVLRGMAKWPNVPAVFGWLTLDRRGGWLIQGEHVASPTITGYIARNYERDGEGRWFFQNGPQRVFVELQYTPFVYKVANANGDAPAVETHTGQSASRLAGAWIDEDGVLLIETEHGIGLVDDRDVEKMLPFFIDANGNALPESVLDEAMGLLQQGRDAPVWLKMGESNVKVAPVKSGEVPTRFGYARVPVASGDQGTVAAAC